MFWMFDDPLTKIFIVLVILNVVLAPILGHEPRLHWKWPFIR